MSAPSSGPGEAAPPQDAFTPPVDARGRVASPCINVCRIHPQSGLCEGCLRTLDEIAAWSTMSDEAKRQVWHRLEARRDEQF